ncbi:MAG: hypothetical protein ACRCWM_11495 [Sarcina sp.]
MKDVIRVERKRILSNKKILTIVAFTLIFSLLKTLNVVKQFNIYNAKGEVEISAMENLKRSRNEPVKELNKNEINDVVVRKDKSKYLYNSELTRLVSLNFPEKKLIEITQADMKNFYDKRAENIVKQLKYSGKEYSREQLEYIKEKAEMNESLKVGYAKGWEYLNNSMTDIVLVILVLVTVILIPLFGVDPKIKMQELNIVSRNGRQVLMSSRVVVGIGVSSFLYGIIILVFSLVNFSFLGIKGFNLPIQNSIRTFFSIYDLTYLEQFILNLIFGFLAMLLVVIIVMFVTVIFNQIITSGVVLTFIWVVMLMIPQDNFMMNHYIANFLPYNITDFNKYYLDYEFYNVFGNEVLELRFIFFIILIKFAILIFILRRKINKKLNTN